MPDAEEQLQMFRNEEKAERDEYVAEELTQADRLAMTLDTHWSEVRGSKVATPPAAPKAGTCTTSTFRLHWLGTPAGLQARRHTDLYLAPEAFREAFAADVDPETSAVMAAAQRPYAAAAFAAAPSAPPAWNTLPCWYLLGTEDKAIPPALQRFMAERANATIVEVPASHVSFVSQPQAATQLILQAIEATTAAS
jgi:pimeloyl-ACP methyl ester carboxylesterase